MKRCLSGLCALLMLLSFAGCQQEQTGATAPELLEPVGVKMDAAPAEYGDIYNVAYMEGEVIPFVQTLYFDSTGVLGKLNVKVGEPVKAGDVLATLNQSKNESAIAALEAEIAHEEKLASFSDQKAEMDIRIAEAELEIMRRDGATSEELNVKWIKIQQLKTNLRQAKQLREPEMKKMYDELDALKTKIGTYDLLAPFDGEVVYVNKRMVTGNSLDASMPLIVIADKSRTYVSVSDLTDAEIREASQINARVLDREVELVHLTEVDHPELKEVFSAAGGKLFACATDEQLECGEYAGILVFGNLKKNVLTVPVNAVHRDRSSTYVYKIVDGDRVRCDVEVGQYSASKVEILAGLQEGELVYVQG